MRLVPFVMTAPILLTAVAAPAAAQTVVPTDAFAAVELHGGGVVNIRPGPVRRVALVRGDPKEARVEVTDREHGGRLMLSPCEGECSGSHPLEVEIETPMLNAAAVHGGGHIYTRGAFPAQGAVSAVIHGGGDIDMRDVPAQAVSAEVHGGGKIMVAAQNSLSADIVGGGSIRYAGQPTVSSSVRGGGGVSPIQ